MKVRQPTALRLIYTFEVGQLRISGDTDNVLIRGMVAQDDDVLLCADYYNRRVKSVSISKRSIYVLFEEPDKSWRVSNCLLLDVADGKFLAITENMEGLDECDMRIVIAGPRDSSGLFRTHHIVTLPDRSRV